MNWSLFGTSGGKRSLLAALGLIATLGSCVQASGESRSAIDSHLRRLAAFGYSGAILVALDGKVILRKGYGFADREQRIPNGPETLFDIGSLAKNFTAAAI